MDYENRMDKFNPEVHKWYINGFVTSKKGIFYYFREGSFIEEKYFTIDVEDEYGEIRLTFFNEFCDKFYDEIQGGDDIYIYNCYRRPEYKKYSPLGNRFEINCTSKTKILNIPDVQCQKLGYYLASIEEIANCC